MTPQAAYLHVPFCRHRCGYCNFTLVAGRADLVPAYLDALNRELAALTQPRPVRTLFIGGGTPTFLRGADLARLLDLVNHWHPLLPGGEFSVEANPADIDAEILGQLRAGGVTRVSLGGQSFSPRKLQLLERDHDAARIEQAVRHIQDAGLVAAVDLIFGAPGETRTEWQNDLDQLSRLAPAHVSTYGLTWERGTRFWNRRLHGELQSVDEATEATLYELAMAELTAAGYFHYEISNFAQPGRECAHNLVYWAGGEYYAAGPGAARYVAGERSTNHRSTTTWLARLNQGLSPVAERERLSPDERARELAVFALRQIAGFEVEWWQEQTGQIFDQFFGDSVARLRALGLLEIVTSPVEQSLGTVPSRRARLTHQGIMLADSVCEELLRSRQRPAAVATGKNSSFVTKT
ncbi:MAG: radical SAM family heme chaperone HemW [Pirellulales bacterium]|nr:radical SAM family heme chaperone HemW [Pirellulales bacterium]